MGNVVVTVGQLIRFKRKRGYGLGKIDKVKKKYAVGRKLFSATGKTLRFRCKIEDIAESYSSGCGVVIPWKSGDRCLAEFDPPGKPDPREFLLPEVCPKPDSAGRWAGRLAEDNATMREPIKVRLDGFGETVTLAPRKALSRA